MPRTTWPESSPEPGSHRRQAAASLVKPCPEQHGQSRLQSRGHTDARPLLHLLHWLPVRQRVTYKLAVLTNKVGTTATPTYLSKLVQTHAPPQALRSSDAPLLVVPRIHNKLARRAFLLLLQSIHLELSNCCYPTVRKHSHFQTPLENPSVQTHLVLLCCINRLCIFRPKGAIQIRYYYYYYY